MAGNPGPSGMASKVKSRAKKNTNKNADINSALDSEKNDNVHSEGGGDSKNTTSLDLPKEDNSSQEMKPEVKTKGKQKTKPVEPKELEELNSIPEDDIPDIPKRGTKSQVKGRGKAKAKEVEMDADEDLQLSEDNDDGKPEVRKIQKKARGKQKKVTELEAQNIVDDKSEIDEVPKEEKEAQPKRRKKGKTNVKVDDDDDVDVPEEIDIPKQESKARGRSRPKRKVAETQDTNDNVDKKASKSKNLKKELRVVLEHCSS